MAWESTRECPYICNLDDTLDIYHPIGEHIADTDDGIWQHPTILDHNYDSRLLGIPDNMDSLPIRGDSHLCLLHIRFHILGLNIRTLLFSSREDRHTRQDVSDRSHRQNSSNSPNISYHSDDNIQLDDRDLHPAYCRDSRQHHPVSNLHLLLGHNSLRESIYQNKNIRQTKACKEIECQLNHPYYILSQ